MLTCEKCNTSLDIYESNQVDGMVTCDSCFAEQKSDVEEFDCHGVNPAETAKWKSLHDDMREEERLATAPDYRFGIFVLSFLVFAMTIGFFFERSSEDLESGIFMLYSSLFVSLLFVIHQHFYLRKKFFNDDPSWKRDESAIPKKISMFMLAMVELYVIILALQHFSWEAMIALFILSLPMIGGIYYLKRQIR